MRKFVVVLLLMLLPLQQSWALVASYCQPDAGVAVAHDDHAWHPHADSTAAATAEHHAPASHTSHEDCGLQHVVYSLIACDGLALPGVNASARPQPGATAGLTSAPTTPPERPQWAGLA